MQRFRKQAFAVPFGGDRILCRVLGRYKFLASAADFGLAPHLIADGYWELPVTRCLSRHVRPGMACVDAGANIGYFTVLMADLAGPAGHVTAIEPIPATLSLLRANLALNGADATTTVAALTLGAEQKDVVTLIIPEGEPKNAIVQPDGADYALGRRFQEIRAPMTTLDALGLDRVDLIKIDVEGAEVGMWEGMTQTLERNRAITVIMEVNCGRYGDPGGFLDRIEAQFPLRRIDDFGDVVPTSRAQLLAAEQDVMLFLRR